MPGKLEQPQSPSSPFLLLPPELRLQIYSYILDIPSPYTDLTHSRKPLIVIDDTGNKFTSRAIYRALHISPNWVGINDSDSDSETSSKAGSNTNAITDRKTLSLLSVNRQIHAEVEHFLYTSHTLFFLNGFDIDYLGPFLDTLSPTARACIRSIGFEVYLFVHNDSGPGGSIPPKRSFRQYERAAKVVREKLPSLERVVFYLDPWYAVCCDDAVLGAWCDEGTVLARGVGLLFRAFGEADGGLKGGLREGERLDLDFLPTSMKLPLIPAMGSGKVTGAQSRSSLVSVR
ncbi:uncharacterized protein BDV17DRAFT_147484 [Aspergillus undulatus]|uniref:uncharacterized protein n=1 Tax=Aspergillus undulatus TaxID=1810928 RepID=UPI003CCDA759